MTSSWSTCPKVKQPDREKPGADHSTQGSWRSIDAVELATLGWVHWHSSQRLHSHLGDTPPAEFEEAYAARQADHALVGNQ